jgi:hypothetical protein
MASRTFYSLRGGTEFNWGDAAAAATTQNGDIEVRINLAAGWTMAEVQQKLSEAMNVILKNQSKSLPFT